MRLLVVHYHWRPGGVRQVVEHGLPAVVAQRELGVREVVLAAGEDPPAAWAARLVQAIHHVWTATAPAGVASPPPPVRFVTEPALGYAAEWPGSAWEQRQRVMEAAAAWLADGPHPVTVWLQNPAVGRNVSLAAAFHAACAQTGALLVCHHHDFFFDNRWAHWPAMAQAGWTTLAEALSAAVPRGRVLHRVVSHHDEAWLAAWVGPDLVPAASSRRWPNPVLPWGVGGLAKEECRPAEAARRWWRQQFGPDTPVWLVPARGMRRKNLLEALLLARWLAPDAVVVVTGVASSPAEGDYWRTLTRAAQERGWPLRLGVLAQASPIAPAVRELLPLAARVVVSSLFEGFGLVAREARAAGVPVWLRREACGGPLPAGADVYDEVIVPRAWLDWDAELPRQRRRWHALRAQLPADLQPRWTEPTLWSATGPLPFSRLTLEGQLDVLRRSPAQLAEGLSLLRPSTVPAASAEPPDALSAEAFGRRVAADFLAAWQAPVPTPPVTDPLPPALLSRLTRYQHYPLLWPEG